MYNWRRMTFAERLEALEQRKSKRHPWHSPPHRYLPGARQYLLSAACFEHEPIIAESSERLDQFADQVLQICEPLSEKIYAWCVLPNHYHVLLQTKALKPLMEQMGRMHGR